MGDVLVTMRVMPDDMGGFEQLKKDLMEALQHKTGGKVKSAKMSEKEVAFGMKAIKLDYVIADGPGVVEEVEKAISAVPNVSSCEVDGMDRLGV